MTEEITHQLLNLRDGLLRFSHFSDGTSAWVCREVINGDAYPLVPESVLPNRDVLTIYDVGSNVGASCVYWCDSYPNAKVYAYEPGLSAYMLLCENTAKMRVEPHNVALGNSDGTLELYHGLNGHACDSLYPYQSDGHEIVTMERACAHLYRPCDILKIDTEGSEREILEDLTLCLDGYKVIYVEYHSEQSRLSVDELLQYTHILWRASIEKPHRGTLCYVLSTLIPAHDLERAI